MCCRNHIYHNEICMILCPGDKIATTTYALSTLHCILFISSNIWRWRSSQSGQVFLRTFIFEIGRQHIHLEARMCGHFASHIDIFITTNSLIVSWMPSRADCLIYMHVFMERCRYTCMQNICMYYKYINTLYSL